MAVVKDDFPRFLSGKSDRCAALGGNERQGKVIAGVDGIAGPAIPAKDAGTLRFDGPAYDAPFFAVHIKVDLAMRIGPHEFGNVPIDRDRMLLVVSSIPMMRLDRRAKHQDRNDQSAERKQLGLHLIPRKLE